MKTPEELGLMARAALRACPAQEVEVWVRGTVESQLRFAAGTVTTSGVAETVTVEVTAAYGGRAATASTAEATPEGISRVARTAADLAKLVPPSLERLPPVGPQRYPATFAWDPASGRSSPEEHAALAAAVLEVARAADLVASGFLQEEQRVIAFQNSRGASGNSRATLAELSTTLRTADGKQSGWAGASSVKASGIDARALAGKAADKALRWKEPAELPPGRYATVLEPAAAAPLLGFLFEALDRRSADEGRSPLSRPEGGTRIGESVFAPALSLSSDPADRLVPGSPFAEDGLAAQRFLAVDRGRLVALPTSRRWARAQKIPVTPCGGNWRLSAESPLPGLEALAAGIERGVLVTRVWYARLLEPQNLTVTGLTRDATFRIEDGEIGGPVKNFRLNQSLLDLLRDVDGTGPVELVGGVGIPALRVKEVGFSALSEAV